MILSINLRHIYVFRTVQFGTFQRLTVILFGVTTMCSYTCQLYVFWNLSLYYFKDDMAIDAWSGVSEFRVLRIPEDGILVPKHVGVMLIMNCVLW